MNYARLGIKSHLVLLTIRSYRRKEHFIILDSIVEANRGIFWGKTILDARTAALCGAKH